VVQILTANREPGKISQNTTLIDMAMFGVAGANAVFLVEGEEKTCLIDAGTQADVSRIIKTLKQMNAFPPDYVLLTHAHWDHSQGIPKMRKKASREFEVFASEKSIPLLEDQSWNAFADPKRKFHNITDVTPLKEGETIDLGGVTLKIFGSPGHTKDHIVVLDEQTKNLFLGDAIGNKLGDQVFLSVCYPPFFSKDDFYATLDKLKGIDYETLSLSHFGYITGEEARTILDEARAILDKTWGIFETAEQEDKLADIKYIIELWMQELQPVFPDMKIEKFMMRFMLGLIGGARKIIRKPPLVLSEILLADVLAWQVEAFKIAKGTE
jgi:glyoxylase-like metal-dependent hydrolase (beta-lactamase superfamily II)